MSQPGILQPAKTELSSEHFAFWFVLAILSHTGLLPIFIFEILFVCFMFLFLIICFFLRERKDIKLARQEGGRNWKKLQEGKDENA